jgi:hypothetical protein
MQLGLGGSRGDAEQAGDLLVLEPLDIVKHEDLTRAVGQALEGRLESSPKSGVA